MKQQNDEEKRPQHKIEHLADFTKITQTGDNSLMKFMPFILVSGAAQMFKRPSLKVVFFPRPPAFLQSKQFLSAVLFILLS